MSRRALLTALVACLVLLAGCNGLLGSNGNATDADLATTTTPRATGGASNDGTATGGSADGGYGTTIATPAGDDGSDSEMLAPGLTSDGVVDGWKLAQAHVAVLRNTSYTATSTETDWFENGTLSAYKAGTSRVGANGSASFSTRFLPDASASPGSLARYDSWTNGSDAFVRTQVGNGSVRYSHVSELTTRGDPTDADTLYGFYTAHEFAVVDRFERNGTRIYRLASTGTTYGVGGSTLSNTTVTLTLDERGVVREYHLSGEKTVSGGTFHVDRTVRFSHIGNTTVERPPWFEESVADDGNATSA